jgi:drug/metabolite transporter (DMT)-like permease
VVGGCSLALSFASYRYIAVGVSSTINKAIITVSMVAFGWLLLHQSLSLPALIFMAIIVLGSILLGLERNAFPHLDNRHALGISLCILSAFCNSFAFYALAVLTAVADPLTSGYFWETSIALACGVLIAMRYVVFGIALQKITWKNFLVIAACSAPTLVGTGFFSLALRLGPVAILYAIGSGSIAVTALLAWGMYKEKLSRKQWISIALILVGVVAMRFV